MCALHKSIARCSEVSRSSCRVWRVLSRTSASAQINARANDACKVGLQSIALDRRFD